MSDNRITFGGKAVKRISDTVKRVEGTPFGEPDQRRTPAPWNPGIMDAVVTTAITECSGNNYGVGYAQIKIDDDSDVAQIDPAYPDPVRVLNWSETSGTIAIGKHIKVNWRNGKFGLVVRDC
jgi:hypothetical protein